MEKECDQINFSTKDGYVFISQDDTGGGEQCIRVAPDQVDLLINWLQQAKDELRQKDE